MTKTNAFLIQEKLKEREYVTVPWIQTEFGLSYGEAKEFLSLLICRGFIKAEPQGLQFSVVPENLCLRKLRRDEVDGLIAEITVDCVCALACIRKRAGAGASFGEIVNVVHGDEDTEEALGILRQHGLIYSAGDVYFLTVSNKVVNALENMIKLKRWSGIRRREKGPPLSDEEIARLFGELFEDE